MLLARILGRRTFNRLESGFITANFYTLGHLEMSASRASNIESEVARAIDGFRLKESTAARKSIVPPSLRLLLDPNSELSKIESYLDNLFSESENGDHSSGLSDIDPISDIKIQQRNVSDALTSLILSVDAVQTAQLRNSDCNRT